MTNCGRILQKVEGEKLLYALDKYADYGVLISSEDKELAKKLLDEHNLKGIYSLHGKLLDGKKPPEEVIVEENDLKFLVNLQNPNYPGIRLDLIKARETVKDQAKSKDVLDLFATTGSFGIYALAGKAKNVTLINPSEVYKEWIENNFKLNNSLIADPSVKTVWQESPLNYIDLAIETFTTFDIILMNFTEGVNDNFFDLQKEHSTLIRKVQNKILRPGGLIFFSTDKQDFALDQYIRPGADKMTKKTVPDVYLPLRPHQSYVFYN